MRKQPGNGVEKHVANHCDLHTDHIERKLHTQYRRSRRLFKGYHSPDVATIHHSSFVNARRYGG